MLHLFSMTGEPSKKHYLLMNGDLVDRGSWSIEVILTAFAYKCRELLGYQSSPSTNPEQGSAQIICSLIGAITKQKI
jgi:hypothetical protein